MRLSHVSSYVSKTRYLSNFMILISFDVYVVYRLYYFVKYLSLQVKFARPETDKAKANRLSSFKYLEKKQAEEPWVDLSYCTIQVE